MREKLMKHAKIIFMAMVFIAFFQTSYGAWLSFQGNPQHTGRTDTEGPFSPDLNWYFDTGYIIQSSCVVNQEGTIFVGTHDINPVETKQNSLYAISQTGQPYWSLGFPDRISSTCAIDSNSNLYLGCEDGKIYSVNKNGTIRWSYTTYDFITSSPSIASDGTVFCGSNDGLMYALNSNGLLKWSYSTGSGILSSPCLSSDYGTVYFGNDEGNFYALSTANGGLKWSKLLGGAINSSPAIGYQNSIVVGCSNKRLFSIDYQGNTNWFYVTSGEIVSTPAIGKSGNIFCTSKDGNLYSIKPDGKIRWIYSSGSELSASPSIDGAGRIYFGSLDKSLYCLDNNGELLFSYATNGRIEFSSPTIASNGIIYISSTDGKVYAIGQGLNQVRVPFCQNSKKNKLTSFLMVSNPGESAANVDIKFFDADGIFKYNNSRSIPPGQLDVVNLQSYFPDFMGSLQIQWSIGKVVLYSIIFNADYGTGYPLSSNIGGYKSPIYFPYWIYNPGSNRDTFFMLNNAGSNTQFLKLNFYDSLGTYKNSKTIEVPKDGMKVISASPLSGSSGGFGYIDWLGRSTVSPFGVVFNLSTNKGFPLNFHSLRSSPIIVPYMVMSQSQKKVANLCVFNPTGKEIVTTFESFSLDGESISSKQDSIDSGKQILITLPDQNSQGWGRLSWNGAEPIGAYCFMEDQSDYSAIPISLGTTINEKAYIPFWQVLNSLLIDTYFIMTNFDFETDSTYQITLYNANGQEVTSKNGTILAGKTAYISAKSLSSSNNAGYGVITTGNENVAVWIYAYNGNFNVGYSIDPQYPMGSEN
jgi:outer membrane protein assembly factor BamB